MAYTALGIQVEGRQVIPVVDLASAKPAIRFFTTLHDNQPKALFHFFLRDNRAEARWLSVGSVFLEGLTLAPAGEPTFELRLSPERSGDILLELRDQSSGMRKRLLFPASRLAAGIQPSASSRMTPAGRRPRRILLAAAAFVSAALVVFAFLLLTARLSLPPVVRPSLGSSGLVRRQADRLEPAKEAEQASAGRSPSGAQEGGRSTGGEEPRLGREDEPSATSTGSAAGAIPPGEAAAAGANEVQSGLGQGGESLPYRIHWGDTLWQITEHYYGNAVLYPLLARENGISNPHVLIAGMEIRLPPKIDDEERKDSQ